MSKIHFVSGLPRSGSTLLMNLLAQNPNHYCTPTSGLVEIVTGIQKGWPNVLEFQAEGLDKVRPRISQCMRGCIEGYFRNELDADNVVFDKSRGWLNYIEDLEKCLDREISALVPIRDVRDILASFEKLYRSRDLDYRYPVGDGYLNAQTLRGRCENLLSSGGVVGIAVNRLRDAINRLPGRLIVLPFSQLTSDPIGTLGQVTESLGLSPFEYNPNEVEQKTHENDVIHGMDLHVIRPKVEPVDSSWQSILGDEYGNEIGARYKDINDLSNVVPVVDKS